ncbi:hypothetical protein OHB26_38815 (plasmid) [Nocardia sp. NBC_01503]|uniref:hypothetical protein n=1 Tax=Nocardia sp. NBC_01503 TaxID=2975997 RepID=UPI002E7B45DA|nr:hypothetical protein [Nocardia sp. NBC_01503]WTL36631.1 hypothetical protein OHB26_38815 [Nocardia sp. NBC_01503]
MIALMLHDHVSAWLAVDTLNPENPPFAERLYRIGRYCMWAFLGSAALCVAYAGGRFGWEKWNGGAMESPKQIVGAMIGAVFCVSASQIINAVTQ